MNRDSVDVCIDAAGLAHLYRTLMAYAESVRSLTVYLQRADVRAALDAAGVEMPGPAILHRGSAGAGLDIQQCQERLANLAQISER